jgi:hypothetical protein
MDFREIGAMKLEAIATRGKKRDFIDLYFVARKVKDLGKIITLYNKKYGSKTDKIFHIMKSLVYFADAEEEAMPRMLKPIEWTEVKKFFEKEVRRITKNFLR